MSPNTAVKSFPQARKRISISDRINASLSVSRARRMQASRQIEQAVAHYKRAVDLGVSEPDVLKQYGNMLKDTARYNEAEEIYRRCLEYTPTDSDLFLQLGHLFKLVGDKAKSLDSYRSAVRLDPLSSNAVTELIALLKEVGNRQKDTGAFEAAEKTYHECLAHAPDDADLFLQLGHLYKLSGNFRKAAEAYQRATDIDSKYSYALSEIAGFVHQQEPTESPMPNLVPVPDSRPRKEIPTEVQVSIPLNHTFFSSLCWARQDKPSVSIVILSFQRPDLVENLIKSIWLFTSGYHYEIILVDNGSPLGSHDVSRPIRDRIKTITLSRNQYIGDAYNIGVESAQGEFVVLMNNDIVVTAGWLEPLINELRTNSDAAVVGPKFLYPNGVLQEAGALIDGRGSVIQRGKRGRADAPEFNVKAEVDYVTGATMAVRRDLFLDTLGYDWRWAPGYYEDPDLCFKAKLRGFKIYYVPMSEVFHIESATMSSLPLSANIGMAIEMNRAAFANKWGPYIDGGDLASVESAMQSPQKTLQKLSEISSSSYGTQKKKLGIFFPYEFIPGGGEKYCLNIAHALKDEYLPFLIFDARESLLRIISVVNDLDHANLQYRVVTWDKVEDIDLDIFILLGNCLFPERKGIGKDNYYMCQFPFPAPHEYLSGLEATGNLQTYNSVWVNSQYTEQRVRERYDAWRQQDVQIDLLYPAVAPVGAATKNAGNQILGVGRFFVGGHNKRHDKMIEAFAAMKKIAPATEAELHLAGAVHNGPAHRNHVLGLQRQAEGLPVKFHLSASRSQLDTLYARAKVYWHAAGWDIDINQCPEAVEHFGMSVVEAMSAGCVPLVYAVGGPLEIVKHGVNGFTVATVDEMATWTLRLLDEWDTPRIQEMRNAAIKTANNFDLSSFGTSVREVVGKRQREVTPIKELAS